MSQAGLPAQVTARHAPAESIGRLRWRERVLPTLWFLPALFAVAAFVLSHATIAIDKHLAYHEVPWWALGPQAATSLVSTVATAMLTFLGVVFSTTLVAIQLASGQYSPRVVRVFVRSRLTQVTLGIFLATFVFSLGAMGELRDDSHAVVPVFTVLITYWLLLGTLGIFITFLYGMSRMLRVQYLIDHITRVGRDAVGLCLPDPAPSFDATVPALPFTTVVRASRRTGVVQAIDRAGLVQLALRNDAVVDLMVESGQYIGRGCPVATVRHRTEHLAFSGDDLTARMLLGAERTLIHDAGFVFRQLVDIAIRALSPAVNDPTTAVNAIDRINDLLGDVIDRPDPVHWYADTNGIARVHLHEPGVARIVQLAYVEVIRYGADSPQVVRHLRASLGLLNDIARSDLHDVVQQLRAMLDGAVTAAMPMPFLDVSGEPDRHGLG